MNAMEDAPWAEHRAGLLRFVRRRVDDADTAEDLVQEILLRAFRSRDSLRDRDRLAPWLFGVARNAVIDHYRARRPTEALPEDLAAEAAEPSAVQELAGCLRPFVDGLPERYREAVRLSELEGIPQREVAARVGVTLSGAKSRVQRGRRLLAERLMACCAVRLAPAGGIAGLDRPAGCGPPDSESGCEPCG